MTLPAAREVAVISPWLSDVEIFLRPGLWYQQRITFDYGQRHDPSTSANRKVTVPDGNAGTSTSARQSARAFVASTEPRLLPGG